MLVSSITMLVNSVSAFSGDATYYYTGLGACGVTNKDTDFIVALSTAQYGSGSHCGGKVSVTYQGKTINVTVADKCLGCGADDIDLSPSAFSALASETLGRIPVTWNYA
ncbi:hypothetical protein SERLA73DRAFT_62609 [Serpula lacrymans var. lacrymans S7.3]|uniref:RlpA-like protein double-psi beta-barrel domain-containing protein n=2 Tax=Serpula lacrymans var. lacrymans TaxID=341189 RepID=F8QBA0_SERL3|nr:hypothetical protein SERLA73DRAFT_62609 [Serpula lacrymans var. lacrymans S7.3]